MSVIGTKATQAARDDLAKGGPDPDTEWRAVRVVTTTSIMKI